MQKELFDYIEDEENTNTVGIGKSIRNATYGMIKNKLPESRMRVYEVILGHPSGITRKQIADELHWRDRSVTGRVKELIDLNLIREDGIEYQASHDGKMYPNGVLKPV